MNYIPLFSHHISNLSGLLWIKSSAPWHACSHPVSFCLLLADLISTASIPLASSLINISNSTWFHRDPSGAPLSVFFLPDRSCGWWHPSMGGLAKSSKNAPWQIPLYCFSCLCKAWHPALAGNQAGLWEFVLGKSMMAVILLFSCRSFCIAYSFQYASRNWCWWIYNSLALPFSLSISPSSFKR